MDKSVKMLEKLDANISCVQIGWMDRCADNLHKWQHNRTQSQFFSLARLQALISLYSLCTPFNVNGRQDLQN